MLYSVKGFSVFAKSRMFDIMNKILMSSLKVNV